MFRTLLPTAFDDDIRRFKDPDLPDKAVESFCTFLIIFFLFFSLFICFEQVK